MVFSLTMFLFRLAVHPEVHELVVLSGSSGSSSSPSITVIVLGG
jgi:hypothetical protein